MRHMEISIKVIAGLLIAVLVVLTLLILAPWHKDIEGGWNSLGATVESAQLPTARICES